MCVFPLYEYLTWTKVKIEVLWLKNECGHLTSGFRILYYFWIRGLKQLISLCFIILQREREGLAQHTWINVHCCLVLRYK